jgi:hypothetical protein
MTDDLITVTPVYGHGWFEGAEALSQVPAPFEMKILITDDREWNGPVVSRGHPFQGRTAELSQRHVEWSGHVNVLIRGSAGGEAEVTATTGYALLDRRPNEGR